MLAMGVLSPPPQSACEAARPGGKAWKSNTFNSRHTYDFLADEDFKPITEQVTRHVAEYAKAFNTTYPYQCASAWFNVAHQHAYQEFHIHPTACLARSTMPHAPRVPGMWSLKKTRST